MSYISTNHNSPAVGLTEAILRSIAPDKGLYMPETLPQLPDAFIKNSPGMSLREIAYAVTGSLLASEVDGHIVKDVADAAFSFDIPLVQINSLTSALELFHGPTMAVKDISSRYIAQLSMQLSRKHGTDLKLNVLMATNGNSGGAIADAIAGLPDVNVYILFPKNERRHIGDNLRCTSPNVKAIEVQGSIENCKEIVRHAMTDLSLRDSMHLVTANSVNIARLIPMVAIYFYGVSRLISAGIDPAQCAIGVPVGNMTTLTAAVMARRMGLPMGPVVAGCNANSHFCDYMQYGPDMLPRNTIETIARAMDMGIPSNLPRLADLYHGDMNAMRGEIKAVSICDEEIMSTIASVHSRHGYLLDPHSAVAYAALERTAPDAAHRLIIATAHPAKSQQIVEQAICSPIKVPERLAYSSSLRRHSIKLPPTYPAFRKFLTSNTL
ncbi:MAG: threonine synthase [Muribaculaceae bacterium]|nr:threonine synthase [Muribaculaceae bacterium]MDE6332795.1 threonine synthase [Muribaculaceae bacterium]